MRAGESMKKFLLILTILAIGAMSWSCGGGKAENESKDCPDFQAIGLDGGEYSNNAFKDSEVTVMNFWFTDCGACISEIGTLSELARDLQAKNVKLVGICVDAGTDEINQKAKKILQANNGTYMNYYIKSGDEMKNFIKNIQAYPMTILVDKNGKIIGDPIIGTVDSNDGISKLHKRIDEIIKNNGSN